MTASALPIALTIAGSDSSGGAGIQADLKTFAALRVYGASALTAITAQNTIGVQAVEVLPAAFVLAQIESVLSDLQVRAIKTGMLANASIVVAVAERLKTVRVPIVVDPVMVATSGDALLSEDAIAAVREQLLPVATLITPNLPEAARLLGQPVAADEATMRAQAEALMRLGCQAVLVKGGHGAGAEAVDILFDGQTMTRLARPRVATRNTHGTGCTLSAAIAAGFAHGLALADAVEQAKTYLWTALQQANRLDVGHGHGPVHHMFDLP
jgi:hydroxymethylpyrimidine/phosphomethylpyrimidine kinase